MNIKTKELLLVAFIIISYFIFSFGVASIITLMAFLIYFMGKSDNKIIKFIRTVLVALLFYIFVGLPIVILALLATAGGVDSGISGLIIIATFLIAPFVVFKILLKLGFTQSNQAHYGRLFCLWLYLLL